MTSAKILLYASFTNKMLLFIFFQLALAGLALVYAFQTMTLNQIAVKRATEVENLMTSVERVMTYTKLESEPGYKVERLPPKHWPHEGNITFQDVSLTYYPGGPQVLKKINLQGNHHLWQLLCACQTLMEK